jgi:predicted AAA+ superfamily ATPase
MPQTADAADVQFRQYLLRGGFPGLFAANYTDDQVRQLVGDIYASALIRDVIARREIRSPEVFERVPATRWTMLATPSRLIASRIFSGPNRKR